MIPLILIFFFIIFNHTVIIQCCTGKILHYWISFIARFCNIHACVWCVCVFLSVLFVLSLQACECECDNSPPRGDHDWPRTDMLAAATTVLALTCLRWPRLLPLRWHTRLGRHDCLRADDVLAAATTTLSWHTLSMVTTALTLTHSRRPRLPLRWHPRDGHDFPHAGMLAAVTAALTLTDTLEEATTPITLTRSRRPRLTRSRWSRLHLHWHAGGGHDSYRADMLATATTTLTLTCLQTSRLSSSWHARGGHNYTTYAGVFTATTTTLALTYSQQPQLSSTDMLEAVRTALALTCLRWPRLPLHWRAHDNHDCPWTDVLAAATTALALTYLQWPRLPLHCRARDGHDCPCTGYEHFVHTLCEWVRVWVLACCVRRDHIASSLWPSLPGQPC